MKSVGASFNCQNFAVVASIENGAVIWVPHKIFRALTALVVA